MWWRNTLMKLVSMMENTCIFQTLLVEDHSNSMSFQGSAFFGFFYACNLVHSALELNPQEKLL